jgi:ribose-phosphate pyrophosphokinase
MTTARDTAARDTSDTARLSVEAVKSLSGDADSDTSVMPPSIAQAAVVSPVSILPALPAAERAIGVSFGSHRMKVFSGSSNVHLAEDIARYVGKPEGSAILRKHFADGESYVRIEESVRGCNVFLVQSTSNPANDNLMELLIMIDACRRAHAHQITAVIPYYGYARADRLIDADKKRREALTSKLSANMLCAAGADRVVLVDIHSPQTCGFFDIPVDHVYAGSVLVDYLNKKRLDDIVVVAPDVGGVGRARAFAKSVGDAPLAIIDKRRDGHNVSTVLNLIGDVEGKTAVLVDDMIDTAGTICNAAKMLRECGARQVFALATHAVFSGPAVERLSSGVFEEVIVCDTISVPLERRFPQLTILSLAALIGERIWRVHEESSR